ncbi:hypothetical protein F4815DRAFT_321177 [Daldinia loculata]|nr:hypothetical protein F4815DRAFT_321177 [Daldinia loculata]
MLYHSTRICFNLPFVATIEPDTLHEHPGPVSDSLAESIQICKSSAEEIANILERFKSQHTLGNTPLILVQGAIVATNAIITTSKISSSLTSLAEDTPFPTLDEALSEMSVSWTLASEARAKFKRALGQQHPEQYESNSSVEAMAEQGSGDPLDTFQWPQMASPGIMNYDVLDPALDLVSPEQYLWEPMGFIDIEPTVPLEIT